MLNTFSKAMRRMRVGVALPAVAAIALVATPVVQAQDAEDLATAVAEVESASADDPAAESADAPADTGSADAVVAPAPASREAEAGEPAAGQVAEGETDEVASLIEPDSVKYEEIRYNEETGAYENRLTFKVAELADPQRLNTITLLRENSDVYIDEKMNVVVQGTKFRMLGGYAVDDDGRHLLSVDGQFFTAKGGETIEVVYTTFESDKDAAWKLYDGDGSAFDILESNNYNYGPFRIRQVTRGTAPDISEAQPAGGTIVGPYLDSSNRQNPAWRGELNTRRYTGPLEDPTFEREGANERQSYLGVVPYPVQNRNWYLDQYADTGHRTGNRPVLGPPKEGFPASADQRGFIYMMGEQGKWYSRSNVQYAWKEEGPNRNTPHNWRAQEFLVGGGDADAAVYSFFYRGLATGGHRIPITADFNRTGDPSIRLFIEGIINTEDGQWTAEPGDSSETIYFSSPNSPYGVMVRDEGSQKGINFNFYDNARMQQIRAGRPLTHAVVKQQMPQAQVGVNIGGWRRAVVSFASLGEPRTGEQVDGSLEMYHSGHYNSYRSARVGVNWYQPGPTGPADLQVAKSVVKAPAEGDKYVDYTLEVKNLPRDGRQPSTRLFTLKDTPQFPASAGVTEVKLVENGREVDLPVADDGFTVNPDEPGHLIAYKETIAPNETKTFTVRVKFQPQQGGVNPADAKCEAGTPGKGAFNTAKVYQESDPRPKAEANACADFPSTPKLEFAKNNAQVTDVQGDEDKAWVSYDLVVTNPAGSPATTYTNLLDTPQFPAGARIERFELQSARASNNQTIAGVLNPPTQAGSGWRITRQDAQVNIAGGVTHTYKVRMLINKLDATAAAGATCEAGTAGRGLLNKAQLSMPGKPEPLTDDECIDAPLKPGKPTVEKAVEGTVNQLPDNKAEVNYVVRVRNDQPQAIDRTLRVVDTPRFSQAVSQPYTVQVQKPGQTGFTTAQATNGNYVLDTARTVRAGQNAEYKVKVTFTLPQPGAPVSQLQCNGAGTGLFNQATATFNGQNLQASACAAVPQTFSDPVVEKTAESVTPIEGRPGYSYANYRITVRNPQTGQRQLVRVAEKPEFTASGVEIEAMHVVNPNGTVRLLRNCAAGCDVASINLDPGRERTFDIRVTIKNAPANTSDENIRCESSTGVGKGLLNKVSIDWPNAPKPVESTACLDAPRDEALTEIRVAKVDTDRNTIARDQGWDFELYYLGADGNQQGTKVADMDTTLADNANVVTSGSNLKAGVYQLVETNAPQGFELLPAPVTLTVAFEGGKPKFTLQNQQNFPGVFVDAPDNGNYAIVQVADVRKGDMPMTGGRGVGFIILLGAVVLLLSRWLRGRQK
ncbi:hypothetical protein G7Y31_02035 [Corynebacterium lizhenjunii]|uniref:SpaA-like prealbumin fold domain-containing protein n=1 Tax=Corynebacterium lizhenjunii TaxID=2709394 RepID=A0A7T0KFD7_9CORY|nr:SpaA isopeptide-forming pilin-related protein [Corynebacterium lizhenjunii]QPK79514.1 hypothetical protein G7Y31_02035 [Corynebacterium lizhenjunii]